MTNQKVNHPYMEFQNTRLWKIIKDAINDLIENKDLDLQTREEYVVGYICKAIERLDHDNN